jgi:eukaryotic-like serine/threonine-protein kinase
MPLEAISTELQQVGNYDLVEKIAEGGMGTVYKGRHRQTGEIVAVKVVPPHMMSNTIFLKRFEQEYNAAKALDHLNIVKAIEFGHDAGNPFLVMEFVDGETLGQKLDREHQLAEKEAIQIIGQVAQGLHKAHKLGLIHRDVKPDNILLTPEGVVKLVDLGLVKEIDADLNLTRTNRGLGTPHFMAPEQFRNAKNADALCDIYSMAATMYMMVTGELPFKACGPLDAWMKKINNEISAPRILAPDLSERVDWAIRRSMSADPSQRAASCREFIEDLTGHSTRKIATTAISGEISADQWYMVYKDEEGVVHTVKGTMNGIRRSLKEGLLGDAGNLRVSRSKEGPFEPLKNHPEFRDLVVEPAPLPGAAKRSQVPTPASTDLHQATLPVLPELTAEPPARDSSSLSLPKLPSNPVVKTPTPPTIYLQNSYRQPEWVKWLILFFCALVTGLAGYILMPMLLHLRLW